MRMKHTLLLMLLVLSSHFCLSQANQRPESACIVAGQTEAGELAVVCRQVSYGICFRLTGSKVTGNFEAETPVWIDFEPPGVRVTDAKGNSVERLKVARTIPLNSRQWPWFGPVSEMVCRAGREDSESNTAH
jgi:hypothetical protein